MIGQIKKICDGLNFDNQAVLLCLDLWILAQAWDDVVDDNGPTDLAIKKAAIDLPMNQYYVNYNIVAEVAKAHAKWVTANEYEKSKVNIDKAYMLRAAYYDILLHVYLCQHGHETLPMASKFIYDCYGETLEDLKEELK